MVWWILGILAGLILLLCLTRVGVLICFGEELSVTARLGCFRIQILPAEKGRRNAKKSRRNLRKQKGNPQGTGNRSQSPPSGISGTP